MTDYHYGFNAQNSIALTSKQCEEIGGHCWKASGITLTSNPPQHPQWCEHCGATRVGVEQERYRYSEVTPPRDE